MKMNRNGTITIPKSKKIPSFDSRYLNIFVCNETKRQNSEQSVYYLNSFKKTFVKKENKSCLGVKEWEFEQYATSKKSLSKMGSAVGSDCFPVLLSGHLDLISVNRNYGSIGKELPSVFNMTWSNWIMTRHQANGEQTQENKSLKTEIKINSSFLKRPFNSNSM